MRKVTLIGCFCLFILFKNVQLEKIKLKFKISGREFLPREDDEHDMPDVYLNVRFGNDRWKTGTNWDNQYPTWTDVFEIEYEERTTEFVVVEVKEEDSFPFNDDMGTVYVRPWEIGADVERRLFHLGMYQGKLRFTKIPM